MAEKRQFLRIAKKLCATFVALFAFAITPAYADNCNLFTGAFYENYFQMADGNVLTNKATDTRERLNFQIMILQQNNGGYRTLVDTSNPPIGNQAYTFTVPDNVDPAYFIMKHNGARSDLFITNLDGMLTPGTYTVSFNLLSADPTTVGGIQIKDLKIERGDTATTYQPYNPLCATCQGIVKTYESAVGTVAQNGTPTPTNPIEPVFYTQGDMVLRKINDTYYDSYDATTGKITRRVGVKVLDGTETWTAYPSIPGLYYSENAITDNNKSGATALDIMSNQYLATDSAQMDYNNTIRFQEDVDRPHTPVVSNRLYIRNTNYATVTAFKQFLADQYDAGTPVTVWYPLETAVEETPASTTYCADPIKIATTAYNAAAFAPVEAALESAVTTIKDVVANTIVQADAIQNLQDTKQTMPDASGTNGTCPRFRQCLLIETDDGTPQWFQIADPVHDFVTAMKNNKVDNAGVVQTTPNGGTFAANGYDGTNNTTDSRYFNGYPAMLLQTSAQSSPVSARQFSYTLLHDQNLGGQYRALGDQEWAVTWDGAETGTVDSFLPGVIYGTSRCVKNSDAPTTTFAAKVNPGTTGWTLVENSDALNDLENIEQYMSCFCKMTGVGLDGMITPVRDLSSAPWVFYDTLGSAGRCASHCATYCAYYVRGNASFRNSIMGWAVE